MPLLQVYGDGSRAASSFAASTLFVRLRDGVGNAVTQQEQYSALALSASMQLVSDPATSVPVTLAFSEQDQALIGSYMPVQPGVYSMVRPRCVWVQGCRIPDSSLTGCQYLPSSLALNSGSPMPALPAAPWAPTSSLCLIS